MKNQVRKIFQKESESLWNSPSNVLCLKYLQLNRDEISIFETPA